MDTMTHGYYFYRATTIKSQQITIERIKQSRVYLHLFLGVLTTARVDTMTGRMAKAIAHVSAGGFSSSQRLLL